MTRRIEVTGAISDRLFFAQVREDAAVELEALAPRAGDRVVVIGSGGCTALSLLAEDPAEVHVVDVNRTQNHLIELKTAALTAMSPRDALGFLGGCPDDPEGRAETYHTLAPRLSNTARVYWDGESSAIRRGVLNAGVSERFIALVAWLIRNVVQSPRRVRQLLACQSVAEQRELFDAEWNNWRWRALFKVLLNRWSMSRAYDPAFFARVGRRNFSEHFQRMADHAIAELPVATNYFLRHILTGRFDGALPPYLTERGARAVAAHADRLLLVDGSVLEHLRTLPSASVDCIALSNVCEWMTEDDIGALFHEVERVAAPDARVVYRNFVGWTERPQNCTRLVEDRALGERLIAGDRSGVQARVVVCRAVAAAHAAA